VKERLVTCNEEDTDDNYGASSLSLPLSPNLDKKTWVVCHRPIAVVLMLQCCARLSSVLCLNGASY